MRCGMMVIVIHGRLSAEGERPWVLDHGDAFFIRMDTPPRIQAESD
jgi:hypothetical protein